MEIIFARVTRNYKIASSSSEPKSEVKPEKREKRFCIYPSIFDKDRTKFTRRAKFQMRTLQEKTVEVEKLINSEEIKKEDLAFAVQTIQQLQGDSYNILCSNIHVNSYRTKLSEMKVSADQRMYQLLGAELAEQCTAELFEFDGTINFDEFIKTVVFNKLEENNLNKSCTTLRPLSPTKPKLCSHKSIIGCINSLYRSTRRRGTNSLAWHKYKLRETKIRNSA
ncbi:Hypothetical predicted protein [Cloeon dipterum]|uniref:EF-hand domain-containing protein n=1 Tax=Cloeon dipterum TaxID=197152 RepID=A0A8S1D9V7_9INSE|nr:Hypothetical predicted protein [Cloeon dipterum]